MEKNKKKSLHNLLNDEKMLNNISYINMDNGSIYRSNKNNS